MEANKTLKGFKFIKNSDDTIIRDIKEYFEEPTIFLKPINRIIIGKELLRKYQNRYNSNNEEKKKEIKENSKGKNIKLNHKNKRFSTRKNTIESHFYSLTEGNEKRPISIGIHYQYKTTNEILNKFKEGRKREEKEKLKGTDNLIPKNIFEKVKNQYLDQEKVLKRSINDINKAKLVIDILSKKCKIKKENLLCNTTEKFRIKNQFIDYIESNKNLYEKFGNYCWYMNLRRPKNMNKSRGYFLNIGKVENNIWEPIVDFPDKKVEIIKKVEKSYNAKNILEKFFKEKYIRPNIKINKKIKTNRIPKLNDINNIFIKGKNIITSEKDNFLKYENKTHKYRVFKDPIEANKNYCKSFIFKSNYKYNLKKNSY